jgi:NAD dependent epimerase/dehydratase family enzyme
MLPLFRAGLGGVNGGGRQYVSWVALDDLVGIVLHALQSGELRGPVNAVAPVPVTNRELTEALGNVLSRPTLLPVPVFALRLAVGEMADALLLSSARVVPRRLEETGYNFRYPELGGALRHLLGKGKECAPP